MRCPPPAGGYNAGMKQERWLILSGSYGNGHDAARDALRELLESQGHEVRTEDMAQICRKGGSGAKQFYKFSSQKMPALWDRTFELLDTRVANAVMELVMTGLSHKQLDRAMNSYRPDFVVATFPHWPMLLRKHAKEFGKRFRMGVMVTDAGRAAMPWYYESQGVVDKFFAIDDESARWLRKGVKSRVPVETTFWPLLDRHFRRKDGSPSGTVALLLTGVDPDFAAAFAEEVSRAPEVEKLVVLRGRSPKVYEKLRKLRLPKTEFHEWWDIKDNLKGVDVFVAKPGGALACECVAQEVPMIVPAFIPGQEEGNVDLLENYGVGLLEPDPLRAAVLARFLDVRKMLPNFRALKKEGSALRIVEAMREIPAPAGAE